MGFCVDGFVVAVFVELHNVLFGGCCLTEVWGAMDIEPDKVIMSLIVDFPYGLPRILMVLWWALMWMPWMKCTMEGV